MRLKLRTWLPALVVVIVLAGFAWLLLTKGKSRPLPPLPNPNGYDDFARAGQIRAGQLDDYLTASPEDVRAYVATNAAVLAQLRIGLERECRVPVDFTLTNLSGYLIELKGLGKLLATEGRLAELESRPGDAARSYMDAIRLGDKSSRGGFIIHRLVGMAVEGIGYNQLVKLAPALSCEQIRPLVADLEQIDVNGVTWEEVRQSEQMFFRHELRTSFNPLRWLVGWWQTRAVIKSSEIKHNLVVARLRLLRAELALRCYLADQGHAAAQLDELVPKYLQRVPTDPFSGQPLIYRAQGTNWLLYSVSLDGVDEGGKRTGKIASGSSATGDLFFDSP